MSPFADFLRELLDEGTARLRQRPVVAAPDREAAGKVLAAAYADYRLDVAGPPGEQSIGPFEPKTAIDAAELVWRACWFLLDHSDPPQELERDLALPPPTTPAQHLSADLVLRFLPQVYRRARGVAAADVLTGLLGRVLRQWPLTGVLADLSEAPLTPVETLDHPGLQLLYAERLAENPRPVWVPSGGPAFEMVELVFAERGLRVPGSGAEPTLVGETR
jgi:hypothetical protein